MESVKLKTAVIKTKNWIVDFNILLDTAKSRISKQKYRSVENIQAEAQGFKGSTENSREVQKREEEEDKVRGGRGRKGEKRTLKKYGTL